MGTWSYTYDNASRLVSQLDARGNQINFEYGDALGRLTHKSVLPQGGGEIESDFYYDSNFGDSSCTVFKGQLYVVLDPEGHTKYSYDVRGRVLKSTRYLNVNSTSYTTENTYDDADRVCTIIYPGGAAMITNVYDTAGNLVQVKSLAGNSSPSKRPVLRSPRSR